MNENDLRNLAIKSVSEHTPYPSANMLGYCIMGVMSVCATMFAYNFATNLGLPKFWSEIIVIFLGGAVGCYLYHEKKAAYWKAVEREYNSLVQEKQNTRDQN